MLKNGVNQKGNQTLIDDKNYEYNFEKIYKGKKYWRQRIKTMTQMYAGMAKKEYMKSMAGLVVQQIVCFVVLINLN